MRSLKFMVLQMFELEQFVYFLDKRNKCVKMAVARITGRPTVGNFHNVLIVEGWYLVSVMKAYLPKTPLQWLDKLESMFIFSQAANMKTLWGTCYIILKEEATEAQQNKVEGM